MARDDVCDAGQTTKLLSVIDKIKLQARPRYFLDWENWKEEIDRLRDRIREQLHGGSHSESDSDSTSDEEESSDSDSDSDSDSGSPVFLVYTLLAPFDQCVLVDFLPNMQWLTAGCDTGGRSWTAAHFDPEKPFTMDWLTLVLGAGFLLSTNMEVQEKLPPESGAPNSGFVIDFRWVEHSLTTREFARLVPTSVSHLPASSLWPHVSFASFRDVDWTSHDYVPAKVWTKLLRVCSVCVTIPTLQCV